MVPGYVSLPISVGGVPLFLAVRGLARSDLFGGLYLHRNPDDHEWWVSEPALFLEGVDSPTRAPFVAGPVRFSIAAGLAMLALAFPWSFADLFLTPSLAGYTWYLIAYRATRVHMAYRLGPTQIQIARATDGVRLDGGPEGTCLRYYDRIDLRSIRRMELYREGTWLRRLRRLLSSKNLTAAERHVLLVERECPWWVSSRFYLSPSPDFERALREAWSSTKHARE